MKWKRINGKIYSSGRHCQINFFNWWHRHILSIDSSKVEYYCPCDKILKNIKYNVLLFSTLVQCEMTVQCSFRNYTYPFLLLVKNSSSLVQNFFIHLAGFRIWHWNASGPEIGRRHFGQAVFNMTENISYYQQLLITCFYWRISIEIFLSIKTLNHWPNI